MYCIWMTWLSWIFQFESLYKSSWIIWVHVPFVVLSASLLAFPCPMCLCMLITRSFCLDPTPQSGPWGGADTLRLWDIWVPHCPKHVSALLPIQTCSSSVWISFPRQPPSLQGLREPWPPLPWLLSRQRGSQVKTSCHFTPQHESMLH